MPDIRHAIPIEAPSDRVAELVSSPKGLAAWWAEDVEASRGSAAVELGFFGRATAEVSPYKDAAERSAPSRHLFTKSGLETPTSTPGAY